MVLASRAELAHLDTVAQTNESTHAQMNISYSLMDVHSNCMYLSLPAEDYSRLAPGLCPLEEAGAFWAHLRHPPHSHGPGPGKEWTGYLSEDPDGDF